MSRSDAVAALTGALSGFVCGIAWLPDALLDEVATRSGTANRAHAEAATASSVRADLAFIAARSPGAGDNVRALHAADIAAVWSVDGVFTRVCETVGWTEALRMTASEPGALAVQLDSVLHDALVAVRDAFDAGADAVLIADDIVGPAGPLLSPDYALDALVPCYHRLALEADGGGLPAIFHSDGEIRALLPALSRAGFSAVHLASLSGEAFGASARAARGAGLVVLGGIPTQELIVAAREAGERAADVATALGGVIVCDDGGLTTFGEIAALGVALTAARGAYVPPTP